MTNTQAVIVALPPVMDPIRLVGDEDKHATLLYFGEIATLPSEAKSTLLETIGLAVKLFGPFSEEVLNISRLGSDDPPALVAMLSNFTLGKLREVLKVNPRVGDYLSNADQHPSFTPHVTLAYPDYQGEAELRKMATALYGVNFDRLALWWGDEQINFDLGVNPSDSREVRMSEKLEKFLKHHGVLGQKWGVRKDRSSGTGTREKLGFKDAPTAKPISSDAASRHLIESNIKSKGLDSLSNAEIQAYVTRLNLERQYRQAVAVAPKQQSASKKFVKGLMADIAKENVTKLAKAQAAHQLAQALGKNEKNDHLVKALTGGGKKKKK